MLIFEGNTAVYIFWAEREVETDAGPPGPLADASAVKVTIINPDDLIHGTYELGSGVTNLGAGKYRVTFPAPDAPGKYQLWATLTSPAPFNEQITLRRGFTVQENRNRA